MDYCQLKDGKCICVPDKLIRQILRQKKPVTELDLQSTSIIHTINLVGLRYSLTDLNLAQNSISDASPLSQLTSLKSLDLTGNRIESIASLSSLHQLEQLRLGCNCIKVFDLEFGTMPALIFLDVSYNQIADLNPLLQQQWRSLVSINMQGNQFKKYRDQLTLGQEICQVVDGVFLRPCEQSVQSELYKVINMQEQQLGGKNTPVLTAWRKALFKELITNKSSRLLVRDHMTSIANQFDNQMRIFSQRMISKLTEQSQRVNLNRKQVLGKFDVLRQRYLKQKELIVQVNYFIQSMNGITEFNVHPTQVLQQLKAAKSTLDETRKQRADLALQHDLLRQENAYTRLQLEEAQRQFNETKRDGDRLEQAYKLQDQERQRTISELKSEIKSLQEHKFQESLFVKERQNSEEMQVFTLKQQHEQEIQSLKYDNQLLTNKLRAQQEESRIRVQKLQERYDQQLKDQEDEFTKLYAEVKVEYDRQIATKKKYEEKQNADILTLKQELSELKVKLHNVEYEKETLQSIFQQDRIIYEQQAAKSLAELRSQLEGKAKEYQRRLDDEKQQIIQQLTEAFEKEKSDLFRMQEESHQDRVLIEQSQKIDELHQQMDDVQRETRKISQQNSDLTRIIQIKEETIKQLQLALASYRTVERQPQQEQPQKKAGLQFDSSKKQPPESQKKSLPTDSQKFPGTIYPKQDIDIIRKAQMVLSDSD